MFNIETYKIYNGDCLEVMDELIDSNIKFDMVLTDMPYGTTRNKWDTVIPLNELWIKLKKITNPNTPILLFAQTPFDKVLGCSNLKMLKYEWIWEKEQGTGFLNAKKMPLKSHENILVFYEKMPIYNPQMVGDEIRKVKRNTDEYKSTNYNTHIEIKESEYKGRYPKSIIKFNRDKIKLHPTQKPVALLEYLIKTYTNEGGLVLDFTMGSGSTGVACLNTNRKFVGIELEKEYFNIATNRLKDIN